MFAIEAADDVPSVSCRGEPSVPATDSAEPPHSFAMPRPPVRPHSTAPVTQAVADDPDGPRAAEAIGDVVEDVDQNEQCPVATGAQSYGASTGSDAGGVPATVVTFVLGGLTPLPVTLLILCWAIGKDRLHIVPLLPEAVRWLDPHHLAK